MAAARRRPLAPMKATSVKRPMMAQTVAKLRQTAAPKSPRIGESRTTKCVISPICAKIPMAKPIDNATIDAQLDGREVKVQRVGPATYTLPDSAFASPGPRNIVFTVTAGAEIDLLPMTIEVPPATSAAAPAANAHGAALAALRDPYAWGAAFVLLLIGGVIGRFSAPRALPPMIEPDAAPRPAPADVAPATQAPPVETRKTRDRATAAVAVLAVLTLGVAAVAQPMDQPRRQPDGSVFVPKPTQRLLHVRTTITERSEAPVAVQFTGQIVADPNASGRVQTPQAGRIDPPPSGFPTLGSHVQRGQVLAYVMPILTAQERSATQASLAELNAQIGIAQQRVQRFAGLVGSVSTREINEARAELEGLRARREAVAEALEGRRPVEATAAGVLSSVNVGSGQIVDAREPLFEFLSRAGFRPASREQRAAKVCETFFAFWLNPIARANQNGKGHERQLAIFRHISHRTALQRHTILICFRRRELERREGELLRAIGDSRSADSCCAGWTTRFLGRAARRRHGCTSGQDCYEAERMKIHVS